MGEGRRTGPLTLGVLLSGRGSNMEAIAKRIGEGRLDARIAVVISNRADAAGLEKAAALGLPTRMISSAQHPDRADHDRAVAAALREHGVELVVLAGYMRILTPALIDAFPNRILNIHPSLLPAFRGLEAQRRAWEYGVKVAGCTVHFVSAEVDEGPIVLQKAVEVRADDTPETLSERILRQEHLAYGEAIALLAADRIRIEGRRVIATPE